MRLRATGLSKVPEITVLFWVIKAITTALGEATSDFMVRAIAPVPAVLIGFVAFCIALAIQFSRPAYLPWAYWLTVAMVGVFGTMAADVLHVGFGVPYAASAPLFAVALATVFVVWYRCEGTLSIHTITSTRREIFYWLTVIFTFALGTAVGDLAAVTLGEGYFETGAMFAVMIAAVFTCYRYLELGPITSFWIAYVLTRPLGASFADWFGQPKSRGGIGVGSGAVSAVLALVFVVLVGYLQLRPVRRDSAVPSQGRHHDDRDHDRDFAANAEQSP